MYGETLGERDVDPGTHEKIDQTARFGNQLAFDHLVRGNAQGLAQDRQHARVAADGRRGKFFADLLRDAVFQIRMSFEKTDKLMIHGRHPGIHFEGEGVPVLDPSLQPGLG